MRSIKRTSNPNGIQHHSPGSRSAPWDNGHPLRETPNGVQHGCMFNPFRVGATISHAYPGCAAQPRAMLLDCFAVTRTKSTNPNGVQHQSPGSRSAPWDNGTRYARTPAGFNTNTDEGHSICSTQRLRFHKAKSHKLFGLVALEWNNSLS